MVWVRYRQQSGSSGLGVYYRGFGTLDFMQVICGFAHLLLSFNFLLVISPTTHQSLFPAVKSVPARLPTVRRWAWSLCFPFLRFLIQISRGLHVSASLPCLSPSSMPPGPGMLPSCKPLSFMSYFFRTLIGGGFMWCLHRWLWHFHLVETMLSMTVKEPWHPPTGTLPLTFLFSSVLYSYTFVRYLVLSGCSTRYHFWF